MMAWYIIDGIKEIKCEFVSANVLKNRLWLKVNGKTFYIEYSNTKDYEYAKRGELTRGLARSKKSMKSIKFIFK